MQSVHFKTNYEMKKFIIMAAIAFSMSATAQTSIKTDAKGNYVAVSQKAAKEPKKADLKNGKTFTDTKGRIYDVYVSVNGKEYYWKTSKSGNDYKAYIKEGGAKK